MRRPERRQPQVEFTFRGKLRDLLIAMALIGTGLNLVQCWQGGKELDKLKKIVAEKISPQSAVSMSMNGGR